jgi:hypothetical protein
MSFDDSGDISKEAGLYSKIITKMCKTDNIVNEDYMKEIKYCHALGGRRRVLDLQSDLLQSYTQVQYN